MNKLVPATSLLWALYRNLEFTITIFSIEYMLYNPSLCQAAHMMLIWSPYIELPEDALLWQLFEANVTIY